LDNGPKNTEARGFRATSDGVVAMDDWIEGVGERWGIDDRTLFRARVCVSELAGNIVEHGGVRRGAGDIVLELRRVKPMLEIEISDPGVAFDPVAAPPTELAGEGGRGLRLVRAYALSLSYRRNQDRNIVTLQLSEGMEAHARVTQTQ
jgi:anti-sigma regulatory factor (Ser/Thr protein kinase)